MYTRTPLGTASLGTAPLIAASLGTASLGTAPLVVAVLVATLAGAAPALAQFPRVASPPKDFTVDFSYNTWSPEPDIILRTGASEDVDLAGAFGLEKRGLKQFSLAIQPARKHKVRFQYVPISFSQDATLTRAFTFNDRRYDVAVPASLALDWVLYRAGYEWDAVSNPTGYLGVIAEVKYNQVRATVNAASAGTASIKTNAPIPAVGVAAGGSLARYLSVAFEITGFQLPKRQDLEARFVDYDVSFRAHLGRNLGVQAGYRSIDARYLVDADRGALKMKGPYVGASLRF